VIYKGMVACANQGRCFEKFSHAIRCEDSRSGKQALHRLLIQIGWRESDTGAEPYEEDAVCGWFCPRCALHLPE